MTDTCVEPFLHVEGCFNVRDAGGWPTTDGHRMRTGLLFRADEPTRMTAAGRAAIDELGLCAVIDLRGRDELGGGHGFAGRAITHHLPVVDRVIATAEPRRIEHAPDIARLYDEMLDLRRGEFVRAIEIIARHTAEGPVLVHCKAGKDRTDMVIALVHAAIGVPIESIVEDYARWDGPTRRRRAVMDIDPRPVTPSSPARKRSSGPRRPTRCSSSSPTRCTATDRWRTGCSASACPAVASTRCGPTSSPRDGGGARSGPAVADDAFGQRRRLRDVTTAAEPQEHVVLGQP